MFRWVSARFNGLTFTSGSRRWPSTSRHDRLNDLLTRNCSTWNRLQHRHSNCCCYSSCSSTTGALVTEMQDTRCDLYAGDKNAKQNYQHFNMIKLKTWTLQDIKWTIECCASTFERLLLTLRSTDTRCQMLYVARSNDRRYFDILILSFSHSRWVFFFWRCSQMC